MKFPMDLRPAGTQKLRITHLAGLRACPGRQDQLLKLLRDLAGATRTEAGCVCYILHQSAIDAELFTIYQVWEGDEFLKAHAATSHARSFSAVAPDLLEGPVLHTRWRILD